MIVAGPYTAVHAARLARPLASRFGLEGRLAVDNIARSPQRTATTSNALLIGVFLVTLVTVSGTSLKDFVVGEINKLGSADYLIESKGGTIDPALVRRFEAIEDVNRVAPFSRESVTVDGKAAGLSTGDLRAIQRDRQRQGRRGLARRRRAGHDRPRRTRCPRPARPTRSRSRTATGAAAG